MSKFKMKLDLSDGSTIEAGTFEVPDGKSAYEYAQQGGCADTEEEFAKKLARDIPDIFGVNLRKYGISSDGTNAEATTSGINRALSDAIAGGYSSVVFPYGTYLIAADSQIEVVGNLTVDFNHSVLRKEANANSGYQMVKIAGRHNTVRNATLYGDRETHDYSDGGTHEWGNGVVVTADASCATVENMDIFDLTGYGINITGSYNQVAAINEAMVAGCYDITTGELTESSEYTVLNYTLDITNEKILNHMFILGGNGYGGHGIDEPEGFYMTFYDETDAYLGYSHHHCFYDAVDLESLLYQHPTLRYIKFSILNTDTETEATIQIRSSYTCEDVTIRNCEIARCRTLGIAVTGGKRIDIENVKIHDIGGALPGYAVDIEDGYQLNQYVNFRNCAFYNNRYGAITIVKAREVTVDSCDFQGSVVPTATIYAGSISVSPTKSLNWYNCVVKNSTVKEMQITGSVHWQNCHFFKCVNGDGSFEDCHFYDTGFQQQYGLTLRRCELDGGAFMLRHGNFLAVDSVFKGNITWLSDTAGSGNEIESYVVRGCDFDVGVSVNAFPYAPYIEISMSRIEVDSAAERPIAITPKVQSTVIIRDNILTQRGRVNLIQVTDTFASNIFIENNRMFTTAESGATPYKDRVSVISDGNVHIENNILYITYISAAYVGMYISGCAVASVRNNQIHGTCANALKVENAVKIICDNNYWEGTVTVPAGAIGVNVANEVGKDYVDNLIGDVDTVIANINSVVGGA